MRPPPILIAAAALATTAALSACTTLPSGDPPVCDGRHRRPANPYGSVLVPSSEAASTSTSPEPPVVGPPATGPHGGCA